MPTHDSHDRNIQRDEHLGCASGKRCSMSAPTDDIWPGEDWESTLVSVVFYTVMKFLASCRMIKI